MKKTLGRRIEKSYLMLVGIISLFLITGYFSYAYFTLQTEQKNRISIIAGTLNVEMKVDGTATNKLTVPANQSKEFTVTIKNINDRIARYNFYYTGTLASGVEAGYIQQSGVNIPPEAKGVNISSKGTQTYKIKIVNETASSQTITLVSDVGLDYNNLELPSNGHLFEKMKILPEDYTSKEFKEVITSIVTKGDKTMPSTAIKSWTEGNSIVYVEDEEAGYKLTIGANGKTILKADSSSLFKGFTNVVTMDLSYFDTSNVTNMSAMFNGCYKLKSLNLNGWDTSSVTDMNYMFGSSSLETLNLSDWDVSQVKNMSLMFNSCSSLTSLDLSGWKTSSLTDMSAMFQACRNLATITGLEELDTSKVTSIGTMFNGCSSLTSLNLSNWKTSNVIRMDCVFEYCTNLISLNLSGWNTSSVTNMKYMFYECKNLTTITGLDKLDTSKVKDMGSMFAYCGITNLNLSEWNTSSVTNMNAMFLNCPKLTTTIRIWNANITNYSNMFYNAATDANAKITVDYISEASNLVNKMIATASTNSHVVKGSVFTPEPSVEGEV